MIDVTTLPVWAKDTLRSAQTTRGLGLPRKQTGRYTKKQGMGEGQKPESKAYKDNWNKIFGKKKKRLHLSSTTRGDLCSRGSFSVVVRWRCWERLPMLIQVGKSTLGQ